MTTNSRPLLEKNSGFLKSGLTRRAMLRAAGLATVGVSATTLTQPAAEALAIDQDTLVITDNLAAHWRTFDPGWFYEGNPSAAMALLYEQLYWIPDGENPTDVQPLLASEMPIFSEDGRIATVPLRKEIAFQHTGNEMTAEDVVFSFTRLKNIGFQGSFLARDYWDAIEAIDDYTIQFTMPTAYAALPTLLSALMLSVTDKAAVEAFGGTDALPASEDDSAPEIQANLAAKEELNRTSAGTGPFVIEQFDPNGEIRIERNGNYWGDQSPMRRMIWRNTLDLNAQLQSVQVDEADIATAVNAEEVSSVEEEVALQVLEGTALVMQFLAFNMREDQGGILLDKKVRHAMAHAIDYQGIIDGLLLGRALRPATVVPLPLEGTKAVLPEAFQTNLERAQQLWDESGVGEGTVELIYGSDAVGRGGVDINSLATILQSDLEKISGLTIKMVPVPNSQRSAAYREGNFQATIASWLPDFPGVDAFATPFFRTNASSAKRTAYSDPEMDDMLDTAAAELDPEVRDAMYADIQRKALDEGPYIMLYQPNDIKVAGADVHDAQVHPAYSMQLRKTYKSA